MDPILITKCTIEENIFCFDFRGLNRYVKCLWKDVRVGDIVRLSCDEMIPADILVSIYKSKCILSI